jgi:hypothetical protein
LINNTTIQINKGYRSLRANKSFKKGDIILEESPFALASIAKRYQTELSIKYGWPWVMTFELVQMLNNKKFASAFKDMRLNGNDKFPLDDIDNEILLDVN